MNKLFQLEWRKLWRQKSLYVCFGVGLLIFSLAIMLEKLTNVFFDLTASSDATSFMLLVVTSSGFTSLLGIFLAIFACNDFNQHTIKNIYARGYSRTAVYFTKYLVSLMVTLAMTVLYMLFAYLFAVCLQFPLGSFSWQVWRALILQIWIMVGSHGLYFGLSMVIGKVGGSVALNIIGIELIFGVLETVLSIIKLKVQIDFSIIDYNLENLMLVVVLPDLSQRVLLRSILLPLVYAGVFVGWGYWANYRRDV